MVAVWLKEQAEAAPTLNASANVNGDLAINAGAIFLEIVPVEESNGVIPLPNGDSSNHIPLPSTEPRPSAAPAVTLPARPTWKAHDIDIDILQRKLVRHRYFTPADFLADISLIEDNAAHLNDPDRQARVAEMAANARLHVSGFDAKWTPEFERYKERMKVRKAERERRKAEKGKGKGGEEEGEVQGDVGMSESGTLKRVREEDEEEVRAEKRQREDGVVEDVSSLQGLIEGNNEVDGLSIPPSISPARPLTPMATSSAFAAAATIPSPRPAPNPTYPPFVVPAEALAHLAASLKHSTSQMNVDQLEQLRAGCFDRLWRRRGDWDRTILVEEVSCFMTGFVEEVERVGDEED